MNKPNKRASKEALAYIEHALRVAYFDCSDSMEEADRQENRFNALVDDKIKIDDYIRKFHFAAYVKAFQSFYDSELKYYLIEDLREHAELTTEILANIMYSRVSSTPLAWSEIAAWINITRISDESEEE